MTEPHAEPLDLLAAIHQMQAEIGQRAEEHALRLKAAYAQLLDEVEQQRQGSGQPQATRDLVEAFLNHVPAVAWVKDEQGRYVYLNRIYQVRFRVRLADWKGRTDFELWPEEFARRFQEVDRQVLDTNEPANAVEYGPDSEGKPLHWWVFKFPIQDNDGNRYVGGIGIDVTERKRLEEERLRLIAQLQQALQENRVLRQLIPICSSCRKVRTDTGYWEELEKYLHDEVGARFSQGICPSCLERDCS